MADSSFDRFIFGLGTGVFAQAGATAFGDGKYGLAAMNVGIVAVCVICDMVAARKLKR